MATLNKLNKIKQEISIGDTVESIKVGKLEGFTGTVVNKFLNYKNQWVYEVSDSAGGIWSRDYVELHKV